MKLYLLFLTLLLPQSVFSNESSVQWFLQPLKIKHQVGKEVMTELAIYRFPLFMYYTHPNLTNNYISIENKLEEFTSVKDDVQLKNVNVADLYGIVIDYDLGDDALVIDLSKVAKPEGENRSIDEVVAITLECVRLSGGSSRTTLLTNEVTKKWKSYEEGFCDHSLRKPIFQVKTVPLKVAKSELLYHWSFNAESISDEKEEYAQFPTYGGASQDFQGCDTPYQGNGFSRKMVVSSNGEDKFERETNELVGYTFLRKNGVISIKASLNSKEQRKSPLILMKDAIKCLTLSAKANGERRQDYEIKLIDPRLNDAQKEKLLNEKN